MVTKKSTLFANGRLISVLYWCSGGWGVAGLVVTYGKNGKNGRRLTARLRQNWRLHFFAVFAVGVTKSLIYGKNGKLIYGKNGKKLGTPYGKNFFFLFWCSGPYRDTFWTKKCFFFIFSPLTAKTAKSGGKNGKNCFSCFGVLDLIGTHSEQKNVFFLFFPLQRPKRQNLAAKTANFFFPVLVFWTL